LADVLRESTLADPRPALVANDLTALCDRLEQVETARQAPVIRSHSPNVLDLICGSRLLVRSALT